MNINYDNEYKSLSNRQYKKHFAKLTGVLGLIRPLCFSKNLKEELHFKNGGLGLNFYRKTKGLTSHLEACFLDDANSYILYVSKYYDDYDELKCYEKKIIITEGMDINYLLLNCERLTKIALEKLDEIKKEDITEYTTITPLY